MLNIKSELIQEVGNDYIYDTNVKVEGSIEALMGEASTALCKFLETLTEDLDESKYELVKIQVALLESIYTITKDILEKDTLDNKSSYKI